MKKMRVSRTERKEAVDYSVAFPEPLAQVPFTFLAQVWSSKNEKRGRHFAVLESVCTGASITISEELPQMMCRLLLQGPVCSLNKLIICQVVSSAKGKRYLMCCPPPNIFPSNSLECWKAVSSYL